MNNVLIFIIFSMVRKNVDANIIDEIESHFSSSTFHAFHKLWEKQRVSFETAIELALADSYGTSGGTMNVFTKHALENAQEMMDGFYIEDGTISLLLQNTRLREIPHLLFPDVVFYLDKAILRLESPLSKMFIDAKYEVYRNTSSLIIEEWPPEYFKHSPFAYAEVPYLGSVTLIASNCRLVGHAVVHLKGSSADVGHMAFKVEGCGFTIELLGVSRQPIIAPYLNKQQGEQLMLRISKPIIVELEPKLEGAVTTLFNSTDIFVKELEKFMIFQRNFLFKSNDFASQASNEMSNIAFEENKLVIPLNDFLLTWSDEDKKCAIEITGVTLNGLENVYAARRGCLTEVDQSDLLVDDLRFQRLQVRGKLHFENSTYRGSYDFAVELQDVQMNLYVKLKRGDIGQGGDNELHSDDNDPMREGKIENVEKNETKNGTRRDDSPILARQSPTDPTTKRDYYVSGWRNVEYILIDLSLHISEKMLAYTFISGYINNNVIPALENYLREVFPKVNHRIVMGDQAKSQKKSRRKNLKKKKY